jgi:pyrimidine-nucleoside phosphorylase
LGKAIGNSIEVMEAIECLQGTGSQDLMEVCYELGSWMLILGRRASTAEEAKKMLASAITTGKAWKKFLEFVAAQGGNTESIINKNLPLSPYNVEYRAEKDGYIVNMDALKLGIAAMKLGAGRETKESTIDYGAGIYLCKKSGDYIKAGESILKLYTSEEIKIKQVREALDQAIEITDNPSPAHSFVSKVVR